MNPIHRHMTIGTLMDEYPMHAQKLAAKMESYGLHCVGCHANTFETLEQGVLGHGLGEEALDELVEQLNAIVSEPADAKPSKLVGNFSLTITDDALAHIQHLLSQENNQEQGLRLAVVAGGCAGASYDMKFVPNPEADDLVIENGGLTIFVEKDSAPLLNGLEIHYTSSMMESGFKFQNPNATGSCGCGTSFNF